MNMLYSRALMIQNAQFISLDWTAGSRGGHRNEGKRRTGFRRRVRKSRSTSDRNAGAVEGVTQTAPARKQLHFR